MRCWTQATTLPVPFSERMERGRVLWKMVGPDNRERECRRRADVLAEAQKRRRTLCMQHCVEGRSGTRKRLRGVRGVRGSGCGAMNGGRDGWGDSLATPTPRPPQRITAEKCAVGLPLVSIQNGRSGSCGSGLSKLPPHFQETLGKEEKQSAVKSRQSRGVAVPVPVSCVF